MKNETKANNTDIDWENRVLCSDGNCIGVIGPDGRCKECGRRYEGELPAAASENNAAAPPAPPEASLPDTDAAEPDPSETETFIISDAEWEKRTLCRDGNCIGVIGTDGKCKECGRPYNP